MLGVFISDIEKLTWMMSKIRLAPTWENDNVVFLFVVTQSTVSSTVSKAFSLPKNPYTGCLRGVSVVATLFGGE